MSDILTFQTETSEIRIQKMQFTIINRRPIYINDMPERRRAEVEKQLFEVFQKYA